MKFVRWRWAAAFALMLTVLPNVVYSQQTNDKKPNILVIMGDDIGWFNCSCYNHGMMGYETPNIDRIAKEGALFNTWYGQQSCTAGRAAFITGQQPIRTGLTKVGMPGADVGLRPEDPTIAEFLKPLGYRLDSLGRTILATKTSSFPPTTASTSSSATSTT
jgi:arylsulfatase A-like enzyme